MHKISDLQPPPPLAELLAERPVALFLDFDGTLVDIAATPDGITLPDNLANRLGRLRDLLGGRLAIVSGRSIADIERHLGVHDLLIIGSHGAEMGVVAAATTPLSDASRDAVAAMMERWPGLLLETKPHGIAVHYRQEPGAASTVNMVMDEIASNEGLASRRGKMVVELGPRSANKGSAVTRLLATSLFAGSTPWFVGDDVTDEDGFAAVEGGGGHGILVGARRATAAHYRLADSVEVHQWLTL